MRGVLAAWESLDRARAALDEAAERMAGVRGARSQNRGAGGKGR
jgi:hypothetical protein